MLKVAQGTMEGDDLEVRLEVKESAIDNLTSILGTPSEKQGVAVGPSDPSIPTDRREAETGELACKASYPGV